jgi:hypothetical protein
MLKQITLYDDDGEDYTVDFPAKFEVCWDCNGRGSVYLGWTSADQPAFTACDIDEDPEFFEDYMSGRYDKPCPTCKGERVTLEVTDPETWPPHLAEELQEDWTRWQQHLADDAAYQAEVEAERRFLYGPRHMW